MFKLGVPTTGIPLEIGAKHVGRVDGLARSDWGGVTPQNIVPGNCGASYVWLFDVGDKKYQVSTGFGVTVSAVQYNWYATMIGPNYPPLAGAQRTTSTSTPSSVPGGQLGARWPLPPCWVWALDAPAPSPAHRGRPATRWWPGRPDVHAAAVAGSGSMVRASARVWTAPRTRAAVALMVSASQSDHPAT